MKDVLFYPVGFTQACIFAANQLQHAGIPMIDHPAPEVTHVLLDVPSFDAGSALRGGFNPKIILERLPPSVTVIGGNLTHPILKGYHTLDLLADAQYLAQNAAITADCALQAAAPHLTTVLADTPVLIIGWGRIGKCLSALLRGVGAKIAVAARKESDRAMVQALGMQAVEIGTIPHILPEYRLLFNTVPESILPPDQLDLCKNCIKLDLASKPGLEGSDIIQARGLPGIYAPESSGKLIAETILRLTGRT